MKIFIIGDEKFKIWDFLNCYDRVELSYPSDKGVGIWKSTNSVFEKRAHPKLDNFETKKSFYFCSLNKNLYVSKSLIHLGTFINSQLRRNPIPLIEPGKPPERLIRKSEKVGAEGDKS